MKRARKYPFLQLQRRRFVLNSENVSVASGVPSEKNFCHWAWLAVRQCYRRADISPILLDGEEARVYNRDYRGRDYATNVLSFALDEGEILPDQLSDGLCGDSTTCPQVVFKETAEQDKTAEQHFAHLTLHGTLHLMGYDHIEDHDAKEVEALEVRLVQALNYPNPYREDEY